MKQYEAVIKALENLDGVATLGQLNIETIKIKDCIWQTKTPFASIRRIVQERKEIFKIKPGLWALENYRKVLEEKGIIQETAKNKNSKEIIEFNHTYYQGIILIIGKLKKYYTFCPNQDKNRRFLTNETLGDIRNLNEIPLFSYEHFVKRSSTIDVIWFNDRKMPTSFFEVEHSTDIQNSLLKFNDLQDFYSRMFIVADKIRKSEYEDKIKFSSFSSIKDRIKFLDYDSLSKQYENVVEIYSNETIL